VPHGDLTLGHSQRQPSVVFIHLPRTTLLPLVAVLAGEARRLAAHAPCYARAPMSRPRLEHLAWSKAQHGRWRLDLADSAVAAPDLEALGLPRRAGTP
jgi:hypothetical protein